MTHDVTCVYIIVPQYSRKKAKTADSWAGEGCTLFVFLAEHRGIAHGPLRHSTGNRGHSTGYRGHSMGFHGKPRQVAKHRGGPWHYPWQFPRQSPRQRPGKDPRQRRRTCPRTRPRKDQRKDGSFGGSFRGRVRGQVRGRCRLFYSFLVIHTSRALIGFPLAVPYRGVPSLVVAITLDCCSIVIGGGNCGRLTWQLPLIAVEIAFNWGRNLPTANHRRLARSAAILPQMAAECRGFPWKLQWIDVRGSCRGNCRGVPWQLPLVGGLRCQLPRMTAECRGNCCGLTSGENAVATAVEFRSNCRVLPWHLRITVVIAVECRGIRR